MPKMRLQSGQWIYYFLDTNSIDTKLLYIISYHQNIFESILIMMASESIDIQGVKYNICGKIGQGGAGVVFLVRDSSGASYALKVVRLNKHNPLVREQLESQINIQKSFKGNKHVIQYIGVKQVPNEVSIVLELGEYSLRNSIQIRQMLEKELLDMLCDVSSGLFSIHQRKMIHRDIKPENIIFCRGTFKITDFGVAAEKEEDDSMVGTIPYWAPEMILENKDIFTTKIDVWSLGVTAFECYFKVHPFCPIKGLKDREMISEIKNNINRLTPNFNMNNYIKLLQQKGLTNQLKYVQKKLQITKNKEIITNLCNLFEPDPSKRESMDMILASFNSLRSAFVTTNPRKTKFNPSYPISAVPDDIKMFTKTKDQFYEINHTSKSKIYNNTLFALEIAIWYLQGANYGGTHYVYLDKIETIKEYIKPKKQLWEQVNKNLNEYYLQIRFPGSDNDFIYYDKKNELCLLILVCSVWMRIINDSKVFCQRVTSIIGMQIFNVLELIELLQLLSVQKLGQIEQMILEKYY